MTLQRSPTNWGALQRQAERSANDLHALCDRLQRELRRSGAFGKETCGLRRDYDMVYEMYLEQRVAARYFTERGRGNAQGRGSYGEG